MEGFDELAVGEEGGFLPRMLEAVGVVEVARALREVGRMRDVERFAFGVLQLFQRQRRLAAAGAADHNQRDRLAVDGLLRVVEGNRFVEQMHLAVLGVEVAQRERLVRGLGDIAVGDFRLVDDRATQKARFVVVVVGDDFEDQRADFVLMANE